MNPISAIFREFKDFFGYFFLPKEQKKLFFYAEHAGYWPYFEGVIREILNSNQNILYCTSDRKDPLLSNPPNGMKPIYLKYLVNFLFPFLDSKVVVMTMTDLNQLHALRSINPVKYVYIFHSLISTHMMYREGAFDHYDTILCTGPYQIEEIKKRESMEKLPNKKLVEAGYYRLERVLENFKNFKSPSSRKTILIAPSWGNNNILETCGEKLTDLLLSKDLKVIIRPHPETCRRNPNLLKKLSRKFSKNENFTLEKSVVTDDSLFIADLLISDWSGISFEYALGTERPVLFVDVPCKIRNENHKKLGITPIEVSVREIFGVVSSTDPNEISKKTHELLDQSLHYKTKIIDFRNKTISALGKSSQIGTKEINSFLN